MVSERVVSEKAALKLVVYMRSASLNNVQCVHQKTIEVNSLFVREEKL